MPFTKFIKLQLDTLAAKHLAFCSKPYLRPTSLSGSFLAFVLIFTIISIFFNVVVRQGQYDTWAKTPDTTTLNEIVLFSTTDAAFFVKAAELVGGGSTFNDHVALRHYPNGERQTILTPYSDSLRSFPLLSVIIAKLAANNTTEALIAASHFLIPITAGLTALAIIFAFGVTGYWLEGCVAAVGGALSASYITRSSAGRIDTDQLNLGFMYLLTGLVILAAKSKTLKHYILYCVILGVISYLFMWWYDRSQMIWILIASLTWMTLALQRNLLLAFLGAAIVWSLSGATLFNPLDSTYLALNLKSGEFVYPNTYDTITEISHISIANMFRQIAGSVEMGLVCLIGLGLWSVRHPATAVAFAPLAFFGLLNFVIGNRVIFYSAPIIWFGGAFLVSLLCRFIFTSITTRPNKIERSSVLASVISMLLAWTSSPVNYVPRPIFSPNIIAGFAYLNSDQRPRDAVVVTWWDYGYAATLFSGLPTLHDGGSQTSPSTHFAAKSLLEHDQKTAIGTLKFLTTNRLESLETYSSEASIAEAFKSSASANSPDLFLVVTSQMAGWMRSISKLGNWNIEIGKPIQIHSNADGPEVHYKTINCHFNAYPQFLNCDGLAVDLQHGLIGGDPLLVGWTHTRDGKILRQRSFDHDADQAIQIVQDGSRINVQLLHRQLYESTFNKLYYQGVMEYPPISLHYDDYPHIRIYRIDGMSPG